MSPTRATSNSAARASRKWRALDAADRRDQNSARGLSGSSSNASSGVVAEDFTPASADVRALASLPFTLVVPLLPKIPAFSNVTDTAASWLVTIEPGDATVSAPIIGRIADTCTGEGAAPPCYGHADHRTSHVRTRHLVFRLCSPGESLKGSVGSVDHSFRLH